MTGPEHYQKAEEHLEFSAARTDEQNHISAWHQQQALVHAVLAAAAATALSGVILTLQEDSPAAAGWNNAIGAAYSK